MKKILLIILILVPTAIRTDAQDLDLNWDVSLYGTGATKTSLPFWAVSGKNGIFPNTHGAMIVADTDFKYSRKSGFNTFAGLKLAGTAIPSTLTGVSAAPAIKGYSPLSIPGAVSSWSGAVHELYAGVGWKMLRLDIGMRDRELAYDGLSLTGGDIIWSGNVRNAPGYNFHVLWFDVPGTKGILSLRANYSDYVLIDNRYVDRTLMHNKSLAVKLMLWRKAGLFLTLGVDQWCLWGGTSPVLGQQPQSFKDYIRVVCGMSGGSDASASDQINVLGDHRGRELIQLEWKHKKFSLTLAHDILFDDKSGMRFQNFPDGVNTIAFSFNDKDRWVSDIVYEYVYTKWQSGPSHDRPATEEELQKNPDKLTYVAGGADNYFNNGEYRSGWTYYGKTIGLPLFTAMPMGEDGIVLGVCNNRVSAHHIGIGGRIARKYPYKFKATYSQNYGQYSQRMTIFNDVPYQLSLALEVAFPKLIKKLPLTLSVGAYGDVGELYEDNFGITLRLSYSGNWSKR